ncbi:MAG TPA: outer membrane protein assembly factor BamB [Rhodocyclaceae bacterium]
MSSAALRTCLLCVAVMLGGCSVIDTVNPFSSSPDPRTLPAPLPPLSGKIASIKAAWTASVGTAGDYLFSPAVVNTSVYAAGTDGALARLDEGRQVWRISAAKSLSGGVGSDGKLVVVGTPKGDVLAFDAADGKPLWTAKIGSDVLAPPLISEGTVFVRSGDARIYAFNVADGKRRWVYQRATPALSLRAAAEMTAVPGGVLAGFPGGKVAAISAANGAAIWEVTVALPKGSTELERVADVTSAPITSGREVCAAAFQGRVACYDSISLQLAWARDISSSAGLDLDSRSAYVSDDKGAVQAFDRKAGASLWKQDKLANRGLSRPLLISAYVVVGDFQGQVHLLNRDDGSFVGRFATDGSPIVAAPRRIGDHVLIQTKNGNLYALAID